MIAGTLFLQTGIIFGQNGSSAGENRNVIGAHAAGDLEDSEKSGAKSIVGTWSATVTPTGSASFQALLTFSEGGTVIGSAQGDILLNPPPGVSPGATAVHGGWEKSGNKYLFTVRQIFYTADGAYDGANKVRNSVTLSSQGSQMSGTYEFDITDAAGNVVFSGTGMIHAVRLDVEPLTP